MRKDKVVTVPAGLGRDRDVGKLFKITEMPATQAERWALRALLLVRNSGVAVPQNVQGLGMVGVAILGLNIWLQGSIKPDELLPLLDEMFSCVKMIRDKKSPEVLSEIVSDDDIEEVQTRLWLRSEVLELHTGFSPAEALSKLLSAVQAPPDSPSQ